MLEMKGAVAVITGGGSGIGESIAKYWVQNGGKVVLGHDSRVQYPGTRLIKEEKKEWDVAG